MPDYLPYRCGHCDHAVSGIVVSNAHPTLRGATRHIYWLQCPNCGDGSVKTSYGSIHPPSPAGRLIPDLPADIEVAWREVRTAHAVAAYTAAEMMCRKILMHLAVDQAGAKPGKGFVEYVDALDSAGYVAPGLKPVVDLVRTRGNGANHELDASTEDDSLQTMKITEHLLATMYELPGLAPPPTP